MSEADLRRRTLVVSAVNLVEGGTLTVLREFVAAARAALPHWRIVVMAHDAQLIPVADVEVISFPHIKASWLRRVALEWWGFAPLSRRLGADLWLSLHDMTPRVHARRQAVYCHNPAPFARPTLRDSWLEPKFFLFSTLYGHLYRAFIGRNHAVIVQQAWLREEFRRRFGVRRVIVARPESKPPAREATSVHGTDASPTGPMPAGATPDAARSHAVRSVGPTLRSGSSTDRCVFLYPALARCFKNFEIVGEAVARLESRGAWNGEVRWTIDGTENRYARWLHRRYGRLRSIRWLGRQTWTQMQHQYHGSDVLIFPSRVETWGLPISEAKGADLPLLVADLPYAHETVGDCDRVRFFNPHDAEALARCMLGVADGTIGFEAVRGPNVAEPHATDWTQLVERLVDGL